MKLRTVLLLALSLASAGVAEAAAQETQNSVGSRSARADAAYTGMRISGRPAPAPDGSPRWADFPVVRMVTPGSPAARVGIRAGDVILSVNGVDARDPRTLIAPPGTTFTLRVRRGNAVHEFVFVGAPAPAPR